MKNTPTPEQILADRQRLVARDPFAVLINSFLNNAHQDVLEIIFGEPGTSLDNGVTFIESPGVTDEKMYSRIYTIAQRGHWLKQDIWIQKRGNSVFLYKYDPKTVA